MVDHHGDLNRHVHHTFIYGKVSNDFFIIDSHAMPEALRGLNNGVVLVFSEKMACVAWVLHRCYHVNPEPS